MENKSLVIFSGGQDSMTCLYWAIKEFGRENVSAITFGYNQNHSNEIRCATKVCEEENIPQKVVWLQGLMLAVNDSALINGGDTSALLPNGLPASFTPNRNALFVALAHTYAQKTGVDNLVAGMCQTDYSGYPDCREEFLQSFVHSLNLGSQVDIHLWTPLMYLTKAETWKLAFDLGCIRAIIDASHTCYRNDRDHYHEWGFGCGECPACKLREKGYHEFVQMMSLQNDQMVQK